MPQDFTTIRERIIEVLKTTSEPLTAEDIIRVLGVNISVRDVYEHLTHIAKSVWSRSQGREVLLMEPPVCKKCGYVFKDLNKPKKPSKCPRCKSKWISLSRFIISHE